MEKKKISIITVVFNNVENIEKTINSVLSQTYKNIEYIIIDGGSTDGTIDIIKKHKKNIDYWISEPDKGIYDAMNKGVKKATGDYLYFLNSGDYFYDPNVLSKLSSYFSEDFDLIAGSVVRLYKDYKTLSKAGIDNSQNDLMSFIRVSFLLMIRGGFMPPHQGSFIKRTVFNRLGGYNTKYKSSGDFDFFCKFYKKSYSLKIIDNKIAYMPSGGISSQKNVSSVESYQILKENLGTFLGTLYYIRKIFLEQNLKKLLLKLHLKKLYEKLLKLKMKGFK